MYEDPTNQSRLLAGSASKALNTEFIAKDLI